MSLIGEDPKSSTISRRGWRAVCGLLILVGVLLAAGAATVRVKTVVDNASIKAAPEIGAKSLARVPLGTFLDVKDKRGEWYQVEFEKDGRKLSGFVHEMLVEEAPEKPAVETPEGTAPTAGLDLVSELETGIDAARELIRQEKDLSGADDKLDGLLAKAISVNDAAKRKSLAVEIYLWMGIGRITQGQDASGLREFKKMFDLDAAAAREATRNIAMPKIEALLKLAEQQSLGLINDFGLEIETDPPEARVLMDGKDMGPTPGAFRWPGPQFVLEVKKPGYVPIRENILLTSSSEKRTYRLDLLKRDLSLTSNPPGASIFLDEKDTGQVTDCRLSGLTYGRHNVRLAKRFYLDWSGTVEIGEPDRPELRADLIGHSYISAGVWGGRSSGVFETPEALALDAEGGIYVLDESSSRVRKLTAEGQPAPGWLARAPELRDLKGVVAAAVDGRGTVYIADGKRDVVFKLSPDGRSAVVWNGRGGGTSEFRGPTAVAFDRAGNVFVAESGNNRVKKYSGSGEFLKTWGSEGTKDGQFLSPRAIAVSPRDEIYVLDKNRVQEFSADGVFLGAWGAPGKAEGQFLNAQALAVDPSGCVFVADTDNYRIQKFGPDGKLICAWGGRGREEGRLGAPSGIATDARGRVYVLEKENERVQVFIVGGPDEPR